jgi:hypothetical protein
VEKNVPSGASLFKATWRKMSVLVPTASMKVEKNGTFGACIFKGKQRKLSGQMLSGAYIFNESGEKWQVRCLTSSKESGETVRSDAFR